MRLRNLYLSAVFIALVHSQNVEAAPIPWNSRSVVMSVTSKNIKDVLRDFVASQRIPATIADDISGTVTGQFDTTPQKFLESLAATFGFVWYYDGAVLSIVQPNNMQRAVIRLDYASTGDLRAALARSRVLDSRFPIRYDDVAGTAIVNGPPQYVQLVTELAQRIDGNSNRATGPVVRIFPLHHAWAMDRNVNLGTSSIKLPGVASVLSSLYGTQKDASPSDDAAMPVGNVAKATRLNNVSGGTNNGVMPPLPQNMSVANNTLGAMAAGMPGTATVGSGATLNTLGQRPDQAPLKDPEATRPVFIADQRTNSVLIRDLPERMPQYLPLIEHLDVRPRMIEIEVRIIEINSGALERLGVDWHAQSGRNKLDANSVPNNAGSDGTSLSAVLGNSDRYLMAKISALQESNLAKVDARPKVLTVDNVEAVMDRKTQFFVKVAGFASTDLYSVSTGTSLRVLPMVIQEDGKQEIKLDVRIEDGRPTGADVSGIPVTTSSTITTQAFITQGESLLIAGYSTAESMIGTRGVPGLSKIPLIGGLFRYKASDDRKTEMLYLVSPRVIDLGPSNLQ